jgi:hypothetical protein
MAGAKGAMRITAAQFRMIVRFIIREHLWIPACLVLAVGPLGALLLWLHAPRWVSPLYMIVGTLPLAIGVNVLLGRIMDERWDTHWQWDGWKRNSCALGFAASLVYSVPPFSHIALVLGLLMVGGLAGALVSRESPPFRDVRAGR